MGWLEYTWSGEFVCDKTENVDNTVHIFKQNYPSTMIFTQFPKLILGDSPYVIVTNFNSPQIKTRGSFYVTVVIPDEIAFSIQVKDLFLKTSRERKLAKMKFNLLLGTNVK